MLFNLEFPYNHLRKGSAFDQFRTYKYILTDSRSVFDAENTIFVAISTGIGDGRRFIPELARKGVNVFIVESIPPYCYDIDATFVVVDNVIETLYNLAYSRMRGYENGILITGSIGKTVTKELLFDALDSHYVVRRSPRSWNSMIGFPLSVCDMAEGLRHDDIAIAEIGIDGPGQHTFSPSPAMFFKLGILTPITEEHDEAFSSHADKIREKVRLLSACSHVFYADTDPLVAEIISECNAFDAHPVSQGDYPTIYHALAAAVIQFRGYEADNVAEIPLVDKRREIFEGGFGNTIFHDHFTPDLRSLREALDFFRRHASVERRHVLILGDLMCPADVTTAGDTLKLYNEAFDLARKFGVSKIYCVSKEYADISAMQPDGEMDDVECCGSIMPVVLSGYQNGKLLNDSQILIFGEEKGSLKDFAEVCMTAGHDTSLEVDLDALTHNFNYYRSLLPPSTGLVAMVKASAYGLGAVEIGKTLQSIGAAYLAVAVIDEGIALREAGITMPIMVLNPITNRYPALFAHRLEPAVFSPDELDRLIDEAEKYGTEAYPIHIKLDTGMHRVGFLSSQIDGIASRLASTKAVKIKSVFSHLATADCLDMDDYTHGQLDSFFAMTQRLAELVGHNIMRHILNTAGMMRFASCGTYEMARLGIGLYGISPYDLEGKSPLRPVASLKTHIISLKQWPAGTPIGYGCRGRVERESVIATIPIGYADGVNRHFGRGRVSFVVNGVECPTVGNICMDLCMIDVTDVADVKVGDSVEIFGRQAPVERLAEVLDTIPYEVLTSVSPRVKRVYFRR